MTCCRAFGLLLAGAITWSVATIPAARAGDYEDGLRCWRDHDYQGAYSALLRFREQPYGRNVQVDYMLGTSGCRLEGRQAWGASVLNWILRRYALPEDCRVIVAEALQTCRTTSASSGPPAVSEERLADLIGATARASGKTFYRIDQNTPFNNFAAVRVRQVDPVKLGARLFPPGQRQEAIAATRARVPGFEVRAEGRFVLAAKPAKTDEEVARTFRFLESYLSFLEREYAAAPPDKLITIYLVSTPEDIAALADRLHGLRLGRATMGYSFRDDMSILAVVPRGFTVGTVQHELFHLAARSTFGDIPQWLDEGIASLYEVSTLEPAGGAPGSSSTGSPLMRCVGLPNWRGDVLKQFWLGRPSIERMIVSDWYAFEQPDRPQPGEFMRDREEVPPSAIQMATMLATARYFTLYLQENGRLGPLYERLRKQQPGDVPGNDARTAALLAVRDELNMPLDSVDVEFARWFERPPAPADEHSDRVSPTTRDK